VLPALHNKPDMFSCATQKLQTSTECQNVLTMSHIHTT
jgi:hypothetical protein